MPFHSTALPTPPVTMLGSGPAGDTAWTQWSTSTTVMVGAATAVALAAALAVVLVKRGRRHNGREKRKFSAGVAAATFAFVVCSSVSLNTSYRFTLDGLGMHGGHERLLSCAAFESLIAMCVLGARERLGSKDESPGWFGTGVWIFAALSSVPAWKEGHGFTEDTVVRVIVGSFGAALAAHSALGLELRHRSDGESQAAMARIIRDLRERLMAYLGLGSRALTAQQITQERALTRAVALADRYDRLTKAGKTTKKAARVSARLASALDRAGCATDAGQQAAFRARLALRRSAEDLQTLTLSSPWQTPDPVGTPEEIEALAAETEEHIRRMEDLADQVEAGQLAHVSAQALTVRGTPALPVRADADEDRHTAECVAEDDDEHQDQAAGKAAAAHGQTRSCITARVPHQQGDDQHEERAESGIDPGAYRTKTAALEALFAARIKPDDARTTNAITVALLAELAAAGTKLDRGTGNRIVRELRKAQPEAREAVSA